MPGPDQYCINLFLVCILKRHLLTHSANMPQMPSVKIVLTQENLEFSVLCNFLFFWINLVTCFSSWWWWLCVCVYWPIALYMILADPLFRYYFVSWCSHDHHHFDLYECGIYMGCWGEREPNEPNSSHLSHFICVCVCICTRCKNFKCDKH